MGWKNIKEEFCLDEFIVHVDQDTGYIHIGKSFMPSLVSIARDGVIRHSHPAYEFKGVIKGVMNATASELKDLIELPDSFDRSITVYTFSGTKIVEKQCEELGWPNVTHDGQLMYDNMYSVDKEQVIEWARKRLMSKIDCKKELMRKAEDDFKKHGIDLLVMERELFDFLNISSSGCGKPVMDTNSAAWGCYIGGYLPVVPVPPGDE